MMELTLSEFSLIISWIGKVKRKQRDLSIALRWIVAELWRLLLRYRRLTMIYEVLPAGGSFHPCRHGPVDGQTTSVITLSKHPLMMYCFGCSSERCCMRSGDAT